MGQKKLLNYICTILVAIQQRMSLHSHMSLHVCLFLAFNKRHVMLDMKLDIEVRGMLRC